MKTVALFLLLAGLAAGAPMSSEVNLATCSTLDSRAIGVAGTRSPIYQAFESLLAAGDREAFRSLLQEGSAAGRIYGALGLCYLDLDEGLAALQNLLSDPEPVICQVGCCQFEYTVAEVARQLLDDNSENDLTRRTFLPAE